MFTGIITHLGKLIEKSDAQYTFQAPKSFSNRIKKGSSVAINGVCLTVVRKLNSNSFSVEIMPETAKKTMLKNLKIADLVNLELPPTLKTFISGHLVQGHVDGIGLIKEIKEEGNSKILTIQYPASLYKYIVEKGSIAVNGISLTVITVRKKCFNVGIIPYTWTHTMLQTTHAGDYVNLEVDVLAKYLEKLAKGS